ncbi:MAG TPA: WD40 repeat domain-containing protein [Gemmata sp.]
MTRVAELTLKLLDETLNESEGAELDALTAADPPAEVEHLQLLELEAELRGLLTGLDLVDATLAKVQGAQAERTADAVLSAIRTGAPPVWAARSEGPPPRPNRPRVVWAAVGACAAAVLVAVWLGAKPGAVLPPPDDGAVEPAQAFARLARKTGFVEVLNPSGDVFPVDEGSDLPPGFTVRTGDDSLAVVHLLADDSRFEIESETVVRFRDSAPENANKPQLFLAAGQLTANIPPRSGDRPLVVGTPVTDVFAHSGQFVVSSAGPDTARVDIWRGKVELVRTSVPKPVPVGVGFALVTAGFDPVHIERSQTVDRVPLRTLVSPGARDAVFSRDGSEIWIGNARAFTRWGTNGARELSFYARKAEGVAAFTRDKRFLVTFRGDADARVLLRTLPDGGEHAALNVRLAANRFWTVAPDASWVAAVEAKPFKRVRVLDTATGEDRFQTDLEESAGCVTASADGRALAVGLNALGRGANNKVLLFDAATGARLAALPTQRKALTAMAFSDDGRLLAVGFNGAVQVWDVRTRELLRTITGFERALSCLTFSPDAHNVAAGAHDGTVWVWDATSGKQTQLIESGARGVRSVAFSPDGKELVTVTTGAPVAVWPVKPAPHRTTDLQ